MKLLPRKVDIDKAKAQERKREIDAGLNLAEKVDALREAKLKEEKDLQVWRESSIEKVKYEIGQYCEERDNLKHQTDEARNLRNKLLEPLDAEWLELNQEKAKLSQEKHSIYISREQLTIETKNLTDEWLRVSKIKEKSEKNEYETNKAKQNILKLEEMRLAEYSLAQEERTLTTKKCEQELLEVSRRKMEYENGISINESEAKRLKEREEEIISKEIALADQRATLERAMARIQ